jgi:hypothetical protein
MSTTRRQFVKQIAATVGASMVMPALAAKSFDTSRNVNLNLRTPTLDKEIIGHGDFRYRVEMGWGNLDATTYPVKNCHEMIKDSKGRLIMIGDEVKNNVLIYNKDGKLLSTWGDAYPGGHGLSYWNAGGEEFLFLTDAEAASAKVVKTTLDGRVLLTLEDPRKVGGYQPTAAYRPTETAIGPDGTIYVADGYGSYNICRFSADGKFIDKFGGRGNNDEQLLEPHGVAVDYRVPGNPTLMVTSRQHNSFKRFTLDGKYLETIFLPGAYVCRPVMDGENLYAGVCWSRLRYLNLTSESGFITILDGKNKVVSNPAGTAPTYVDGKLQLMIQETPIFKHCHDVCIDEDKNLYVCQWAAGKTYPIKLHRI